MQNHSQRLQRVLYRLFLCCGGAGTALSLLLVWRAVEATPLLMQLLGTCAILAIAAALLMSATRLVSGPPPEDDGA